MTKAEKIITKHLAAMGGLTNPAIAAQVTGYTFSTCKRVFTKFACQVTGYSECYFLK